MNNWGPAALIVLGYVIGIYFQQKGINSVNKRIDDLIVSVNKRIDDLITSVNNRFSGIEKRIDDFKKDTSIIK